MKELPNTLASRELLPDRNECPWVSKSHWEVYTEGVAPQQATATSTSLLAIWGMKAHITIYIDGSATGGTTAGCGVMVATVGGPADPVIICNPKIRGA